MSEQEFDSGAMELMAYMLTSARGLVDEPATYGPFRLVDGASRLCELLIAKGHPDKAFLEGLKAKIDERKFVLMTDADAFVALVDETVIDVTRALMKKGLNQAG